METIYYVYLNAVYHDETDDYSYFYTIEEGLQSTPIPKPLEIYNINLLPTYIKRKRDFRILIHRAIHNKPTEEIINQEIRRLYTITEEHLIKKIQEFQRLFNQLQQFDNPDPQEIKGDILYHYDIVKMKRNGNYIILEKAMPVERITPRRVYLKQTAETKRKYINSKNIYTSGYAYAFCKNSSYIKRLFENCYYNAYHDYTKELFLVKQFQKIMDDISL